MEECIKMHRAWVLRSGNTAKASAEFASGWDVLEAFAANAPAERIRSDFMQNFVLEFKVGGLLLSNSPKPCGSLFGATQVTNPQAIDGTEWWRSVTVMGHMCQSIGGDLVQ